MQHDRRAGLIGDVGSRELESPRAERAAWARSERLAQLPLLYRQLLRAPAEVMLGYPQIRAGQQSGLCLLHDEFQPAGKAEVRGQFKAELCYPLAY